MNLKNKYIVFWVFLYQIWCVAAFVKVAYAFFISQDIILSKIAWPVETGTFHQSNFRGCSVDCFSVLGHVIRRYAIISFLNVFPPSLVLIVLLEIALWRFNKWSGDIQEWYIILFEYAFQPSYCDCSLCECCDITFLIYHVIAWQKVHVTQWLHAIWSFSWNLVYMYFLKLWHTSI